MMALAQQLRTVEPGVLSICRHLRLALCCAGDHLHDVTLCLGYGSLHHFHHKVAVYPSAAAATAEVSTFWESVRVATPAAGDGLQPFLLRVHSCAADVPHERCK